MDSHDELGICRANRASPDVKVLSVLYLSSVTGVGHAHVLTFSCWGYRFVTI
jgi:hypothetical protein